MKLPKRETDWIGRRVHILQTIEANGGATIKRGRIALVKDSYGGLKLATVRSPHACISRVPKWKVRLLPLASTQSKTLKL